MNENSEKKVSRRDAMKILAAAAGAVVAANLPSEWSAPGIETGVLPAHAQTSGYGIVCDPDSTFICTRGNSPAFESKATISPADDGVVLAYEIIETSATGSIVSPSLTGTATTDASGEASISIVASNFLVPGETITVNTLPWFSKM